MSSGSLAGERLVRRLGRVRERLSLAARRTVAETRPWLHRETFTPAGLATVLAAVLAAARRRPLRAGLAGAALAGVPFALLVAFGGGRAPDGIPTREVEEGPFRVSIVEGGTLQALRSATYASSIQSNQAKIVALVPEGKLVQKGDLLILFDAAPFEEEIRKSQAQLAQAQAELEKARQDYKLQVIENQEEIASARQKVERSDLEYRDVQDGKGRLREEEAEAAVANATRELKKAETARDDLRPLLAEGFITKQELERAEQAVAHAQEELALARRRREALLKFGRPVELSQAKAEALLTKESLRQLETAGAYKLEQRRAAISSTESRILEASSKLSLAQQQLARTEVRADVPGIVVYRDVFFGSEQRKPQVGDQVWANQPLLILPDISRMVVETRVRKTDVHKVERNQKVTVRVPAYPDLQLTGRVTLIGTLAQKDDDKERRWAKFFGVTVEINESEPRLRPGMTARVEIEVEERSRALFVPLEAVFEREGRTRCYLVEGGHLRGREVVLGPSNQDFVVVETGLRKGDRVALREPGAPPSDFGSTITP